MATIVKAFLVVIVAAMSSASWGEELPKMSFINENSLLESFPLGRATKEQVYEAYGPPQKLVKDLPFDGEAWSYSKQVGSKEFTFVFRGNIVHDVIVRFPGAGALSSDKSARKMQGAK